MLPCLSLLDCCSLSLLIIIIIIIIIKIPVRKQEKAIKKASDRSDVDIFVNTLVTFIYIPDSSRTYARYLLKIASSGKHLLCKKYLIDVFKMSVLHTF